MLSGYKYFLMVFTLKPILSIIGVLYIILIQQ